MTTYGFGISLGSEDIVSLTSQTIDGGVVAKDPVYIDAGTWKSATAVTPKPSGVFEGSGIVIISGKLVATGLTAGKFYFLADIGGLTITETNTKIGFALSTTELIIDADNSNIVKLTGFIAGGGTASSSLDKLRFINENTSVVSVNLSHSTNSPAGFSSLTNGYIAGADSPVISSVAKLLFSSEVTSAVTSKLTVARGNIGGFDDNKTNLAGYAVGGGTVSTVEKIVFNIEDRSVVTSDLSASTIASGDFSSLDAGYVVAGSSSKLDKLLFSDETTSAVFSKMTRVAQEMSGFDSPIAGYTSSASATTNATDVDKLLFSNDSTSAVTSNLTVSHEDDSAGFSSNSFGYTADGGIPIVSIIDSLSFATDNIAVVSSKMTRTVDNLGNFDN